MPDMTDDEEEEHEELAARFDGADVDRQHISGTFEYEVTLTTEQIDELPDNDSPERFAKSIATSRFQKELDPTFSVNRSQTLCEEEEDWSMNGERRFTVLVRFDQND
jgi:hypothetical protein